MFSLTLDCAHVFHANLFANFNLCVTMLKHRFKIKTIEAVNVMIMRIYMNIRFASLDIDHRQNQKKQSLPVKKFISPSI